MIVILTGVRWYLHCFSFAFLWSVMMSIFHMSLAIYMSSLEKNIFRSSAHFLIGLFGGLGCWFVWVLYKFWILTPYQMLSLTNIFIDSLGCHFIFCWWFLCCEKPFSFFVDTFVYSFFCFPCLYTYIKINIAKRNVRDFYCLCFLGVLWFWVLYLSLQSILSLFLYVVQEGGLVLFFLHVSVQLPAIPFIE